MEQMRAISIHQPYAWAIACGFKRVENRSWTTNYRGPVAVQASVNKERLLELHEALGNSFDGSLFTTGAVVAVVDLVDVQPLNPSLESDPWAEGPFCWILSNARMLQTPVKVKGKTSLFKLSLAETAKVAEQLELDAAAPPQVSEGLLAAFQVDPYALETVRAELYWHKGLFEDAVRCATKAIELAPEVEQGWRVRAIAQFALGKNNEAMLDVSEALRLVPNSGWAYLVRSHVWQALGDAEKCQADEEKAIRLCPEIAQSGDDQPPEGDEVEN
jgi:tetratricopeptide (TPR) repeat protein